MASYQNVHTVLMARREEALRSSSAAPGGSETSCAAGPRVIVLGPTDSGKSTLCRMLANWAVRSSFEPTMVDLDVGKQKQTRLDCSCNGEHAEIICWAAVCAYELSNYFMQANKVPLTGKPYLV